ncbi:MULTISPECIES: hypothetical protein [Methylobacteriaceae]|uniref:hypothetical protein n=1 Tax=Methylobacteriaceae TaxID=119045 RepID=UPI002F35FB85
MLQLKIEPIRTITNESSEAGHLVWLGGRLAALIVEADGGWYLHTGLGPFEGEGLVFPTVLAIEDWVRTNLLATGLDR